MLVWASSIVELQGEPLLRKPDVEDERLIAVVQEF